MKKILIIVAGIIVTLAIVVFSADVMLDIKLQGIVNDYDDAIEKHIATGDYEAAYYDLNRLYNRLATVTNGKPLLESRHLKWIDQRLSIRRNRMLDLLAENLPNGVENDWHTIDTLAFRYTQMEDFRIATLLRDDGARKSVQLRNQLRYDASVGPVKRLPEMSFEARQTAQAAQAPRVRSDVQQAAEDRHRTIMEAAAQQTRCGQWKVWSIRVRDMARSVGPGQSASMNSPWGDVTVTSTTDVEAIIEKYRPDGCEAETRAASARMN